MTGSGPVSVPSSATVAAGATSANFTIATSGVSGSTAASVTGTYAGVSKSANLAVTAAALVTLSVNPTSVNGGGTATGTVTLNGKAPAGGAVVALSSSNTAAATVPSSVSIAAGSNSASFNVASKTVHSITTVTISASYAGVTKTTNLTVRKRRQ
jgi:hypothetical protein